MENSDTCLFFALSRRKFSPGHVNRACKSSSFPLNQRDGKKTQRSPAPVVFLCCLVWSLECAAAMESTPSVRRVWGRRWGKRVREDETKKTAVRAWWVGRQWLPVMKYTRLCHTFVTVDRHVAQNPFQCDGFGVMSTIPHDLSIKLTGSCQGSCAGSIGLLDLSSRLARSKRPWRRFEPEGNRRPPVRHALRLE